MVGALRDMSVRRSELRLAGKSSAHQTDSIISDYVDICGDGASEAGKWVQEAQTSAQKASAQGQEGKWVKLQRI